MIDDMANELMFSPASIWEVAVNSGRKRAGFSVDPRLLRRGLLDNDYRELAITGEHAAAVANLSALHKDPFDRLLIAQATVDGVIPLTADRVVAQYPGPIRLV
jgi:PIN domain nuclease of toxin-antitoxin system